MTIFTEFGLRRSRLPLLSAQSLAFEQLVCIHNANIDLRWAMVELALRSFTAMCAMAQRQVVRLARRNGPRSKRRCGRDVAAADTMVAAGGR